MLADLEGRIDLIIDSGPTAVGLESTVVDLTTPSPRILRPGPIPMSDLGSALRGFGSIEYSPGHSLDRPASPGQLPVHDAPATTTYRADALAELEDIGTRQEIATVIFGKQSAPSLTQSARQVVLESPEIAARLLYETLHRYDMLGLDAIVVVMPPDLPEWAAVRDRLLRATRPLREARNG